MSATPAFSAKDMPIPDQPEVLAVESTETEVTSKTKVADDIAVATKKADETTLSAKPAPETARSKTSVNQGQDLAEAKLTQTAPSAPEQKSPMPSRL